MIALNNFAWLLSMWKGEHDRAEKLVDRAIRIAGPVAPLLDTRGTIHLNKENYDQAIADFRDAVATDDSPQNRFHLALACWKHWKPEATRLNLQAALDGGFRFEGLYPLEQQEFSSALTEMQAVIEANPLRRTQGSILRSVKREDCRAPRHQLPVTRMRY